MGADYDRVTMDLRCFSEQKVPFGFRDSYDYIQTVAPHLVNSYNTITDCLLQLFNYSDSGEFLKTVFGQDMTNSVPYYTTTGILNFLDAGATSLMHEDQLEGMRRHYARVRHAYDTDSLNYEGFQSCYQRNNLAFNMYLEVELPQSAAAILVSYLKLYVAFASLFALCYCCCSTTKSAKLRSKLQ